MAEWFRKYNFLLFVLSAYVFLYFAVTEPEHRTMCIVISILQFGCAILVYSLYKETADEGMDKK